MRIVRYARAFSICATLFFLTECGSPAPEARFHFPFLSSDGYSGKAEIAVYEGTVKRYGFTRPAELTLITVTEPINPRQRVKSDRGGADSIPVVKQNQVLTFSTGVYTYHYINSLFWTVGGGNLMRATMSSQEWCGTTYKTFLPRGGIHRMIFHSYWENEADGEIVVIPPALDAAERAILYDEMTLVARTPEAEHFRRVVVFPLLMSSQVYKPDWDIYGKRRTPRYSPGSVTPESTNFTVDGVTYQALKITLRSGENGELVDEYMVDRLSPNRTLLAWNRHDGGRFVLKKLTFTDYWNLNKPGDKLP